MFSSTSNKILIVLLLLTLATNVLILRDDLVKYALALSANYTKAPAAQLTVGEWNNLPTDFVAKSGGTDAVMTGPLTLPGAPTANNQAATKQYVDTTVNSALVVTNTSGSPLHMLCGNTPVGSTNWQQVGGVTDTVYVDIALPSGSFTSTPMYFTSLNGGSALFKSMGATSIYFPTATGFRVYVVSVNFTNPTDPTLVTYNNITPALVRTAPYNWHIFWCAMGG